MASESIREIAGRGRCMIAERPYQPGDLVLSEEPYAMIIARSFDSVCCSYCCKLCVNGTMYALSAESSVRYCSEGCITADYPVHSLESLAVTTLEGEEVQGGKDAMRLVFRIASCRKKEAASSSRAVENTIVPLNGRLNMFKHILLLEANSKSMTPVMAREVSRTAAELSKIAFMSSLPLSAIEARTLLYSIQCNAHQIVSHDDGVKAVALGLFPYTSMMNHSCSPNCVKLFLMQPGRPPRLVMRAVEHIEKGEELSYSYVNLYQSTAARRSQLSSAYSFHCICERCLAGETMLSSTCWPEDLSVESTWNRGYSTDADIDMLEERYLNYFSDGSPREYSAYRSVGDIDDDVTRIVGIAGGKVTSDQEAMAVGVALRWLVDFMGGVSASLTHPAHKVMFICYHTFCLSGVRMALRNNQNKQNNNNHTRKNNDNNENVEGNENDEGNEGNEIDWSTASSLRTIIGYGLMALGCMRRYVRRVQPEIGQLEGQIAVAVELLLRRLEGDEEEVEEDKGAIDRMRAAQLIREAILVKQELITEIDLSHISLEALESQETKEKQGDISPPLSSTSQRARRSSLSDLVLSGGYLGSYIWAMKGDWRVEGLIDSACSIHLAAASGVTSSSAAAESGSRERAVLQALFLFLSESSARIAFICRAEE